MVDLQIDQGQAVARRGLAWLGSLVFASERRASRAAGLSVLWAAAPRSLGVQYYHKATGWPLRRQGLRFPLASGRGRALR